MSSLSLAYKHTVAVLSTCRKQCQDGHLQVVTEKIAIFVIHKLRRAFSLNSSRATGFFGPLSITSLQC